MHRDERETRERFVHRDESLCSNEGGGSIARAGTMAKGIGWQGSGDGADGRGGERRDGLDGAGIGSLQIECSGAVGTVGQGAPGRRCLLAWDVLRSSVTPACTSG